MKKLNLSIETKKSIEKQRLKRFGFVVPSGLEQQTPTII